MPSRRAFSARHVLYANVEPSPSSAPPRDALRLRRLQIRQHRLAGGRPLADGDQRVLAIAPVARLRRVGGLGLESGPAGTVAAGHGAGTALGCGGRAAGGQAVGVTLAFNTLGWKPQNILFNALDALIGDTAIAQTPLARLGGEEDLKGLAALFASDAAAHITGQIVAVDGGATSI